MRVDIAIAGFIAVTGLLAVGQAVQHRAESQAGRDVPAVQGHRCEVSQPVLPHDGAVSFAAIGDSATYWRTTDGRVVPSWVRQTARGSVRFAGGYAAPDALTQDLAARARPVDADVLVILTGSADLRFGVPNDQIELNLQRIVDRVGARQVLISSVPPTRGLIGPTLEYNDFLSRVAYRHGWDFVDAGAAVQAKTCGYRPGLGSPDGLRPSPSGARLIGEAVRSALTGRFSLANGAS